MTVTSDAVQTDAPSPSRSLEAADTGRDDTRARILGQIVRTWPWVAVATALAVASIPVIRMWRDLTSYGANIPSGDDLWGIAYTAIPALSGQLDWGKQFLYAYMNGGETILVFASYYIWAVLTKLDNTSLLLASLVMSFVGLWLTARAVTMRSHPLAAALLMIPFCMISFGYPTFSDREFALLALQTSYMQLGVGLGLWGAIKFAPRFRGVVLLALGGAIATLATASSGAIWPLFFFAMIPFGYRRVRDYALLLLVGCACMAPALYYTYGPDGPGSIARAENWRSLDVLQQLIGVGMATANEPDATMLAARVLIVFGIAGACVVPLSWKVRRHPEAGSYVAAAVLAGFGLLTVANLQLHRGFSIQYYATLSSMWIWLALAAAAAVAMLRVRLMDRARYPSVFVAVWSAGAIGALMFLAIPANKTMEDKTIFLKWRTLASESCVRHFQLAMPRCEGYHVPWYPMLPSSTFPLMMGPMLHEHRLHPFTDKQRWSLQGDYGLPLVTTDEASDDIWWTDQDGTITSWTSYERLDLDIPPNAIVDWRMHVPDGAAARFSTSVRLADGQPVGGGAVAFLEARTDDGQLIEAEPVELAFADRSHPLDLDLSDAEGRDVTLRLSTGVVQGSPESRVSFASPIVEVEDANDLNLDDLDPVPLVAETTEAWSSLIGDGDEWTLTGSVTKRQGSTFVADGSWSASLQRPPGTCLDDIEHLAIDHVQVPIRVTLTTAPAIDAPPVTRDVIVMPSETTRTSVLPNFNIVSPEPQPFQKLVFMRELELPKSSLLVGVAIAPTVQSPPIPAGTKFDLGHLRLSATKDRPRGCPAATP